MPDGWILQDTDVIIDHLESAHPEPSLRTDGPVQQAVSLLLCAYASAALLPTAIGCQPMRMPSHTPGLAI